IERSVIDKITLVGRNARVGQAPRNAKKSPDGPGITTVGKNAQIPAGIRIPRGAVVAADATPEYFLKPAPLPASIAKKRDTSTSPDLPLSVPELSFTLAAREVSRSNRGRRRAPRERSGCAGSGERS